MWVVKQTTDGSWIKFGERTCEVTETTTTTAATTTTTTSATTTTTPSDWAGTLSCATTSSTIRVTLDAAPDTHYFEVRARHSTGYPSVGHLRYADSWGDFWTEFTSTAQGTWNVSGTASFNDGTSRALNSLTCVVPAPSFASTTTTTAPPNSEPTGAPTITGTAQVGQTLTADTSGIADADGLTNVSYRYQWLSDLGLGGSGAASIYGATSSTYTPVAHDEGARLTVRVSFVDDAGNQEQLTSAPSSAVVAGGL